MGKWHALKCLKREYADKQEYQALLRKEFELGYHLNHPNIVRIIGIEDIGELGLCIVMEYVEGRSLREAIENGLTQKQSLNITRQLCHALDYIHQRQIIHRDLKPENVMLTYNDNQVKLIDFGLSDADEYAIFKQPAGTPRYAAPEQKKGDGSLRPSTDLYALGLIMQEMPRLPRRVMHIAKRCSKTLPEDRYQSAEEVLNAIAHRNRPWWFAAAVLFMAALFLSVWLLYPERSPQSPTVLPEESPTLSEEPATNAPETITKTDEAKPSKTGSHDEEITPLPVASFVSPDVAYFLSQTAIPKDVQHEPRFVHLAEYAYSITMHFMKTQSINAHAEREAFGYVQKEISKTMGKDTQTADKYLRYLDVLTQIIADDYRDEYLRQSDANGKAPSKEVLHSIDVYAADQVPFLYRVTNLADSGPSETNEAEVIADMERFVNHLVGKDNPFYSTYIKHAHAAAQKEMRERRNLWKSAGL